MEISYVVRVVGIREEICKMDAKDSSHAKLFKLKLEWNKDVAIAGDTQESMNKFEAHLFTQLMKEI